MQLWAWGFPPPSRKADRFPFSFRAQPAARVGENKPDKMTGQYRELGGRPRGRLRDFVRISGHDPDGDILRAFGRIQGAFGALKVSGASQRDGPTIRSTFNPLQISVSSGT